MKRINFLCAAVLFFCLLILSPIQSIMAQVVDPSVLESKVVVYRDDSWQNKKGSAVDSILPLVDFDTMQTVAARLIVVAVTDSTVRFSTRLTYDFSVRIDAFTATRKDTCFIFPPGTVSQVPDSLFAIYLDSANVAKNDEVIITVIEPTAAAPRTALISFANDTIFGTKVDTSDPVYISDGMAKATFGYAADSVTGAVYIVIYNLGKRGPYGLAAPPDTLGDSTFTRDTAKRTWSFREVDLLEARSIKVIRFGKVEVDTIGPVNQLLRWRK